jgi:gliding motility-associated lipoprotein GldK
MYLPADKRINNERIIDWSKIKYNYQWEDVASAVKDKNRGAQYLKKESIAVYPDTTVWVKDFSYAYNEPLFDQYFWHNAYKEYPVVGVTWDQARAYCDFKTKLKTDYNNSLKKKKQKSMRFRLPTEAEWEYAARRNTKCYLSLGRSYLQDDRGCYLANFKPKRGSYIEDEKKVIILILLLLKSSRKMDLVYMIWQVTFLSGQNLHTVIPHMNFHQL